MSVNEKIRLIREAKGLTQEQVAEKLKISVNSYGDIERGNTNVKLARLEQIAELFGINISDLFSLNEKGVLNLIYEQNGNNCNIGANSADYLHLAVELEKQQLIIELKDKELALQTKQISLLEQKIADQQKIIHFLETKPA